MIDRATTPAGRTPPAARRWAAILMTLAGAAACASTPEPKPTEPKEADEPRAPSGWRAALQESYPEPDKPWASMSHDERKAYMRDVVMPTMEELFLAYDPQEHATFGCRTCHGAQARERNYAMPRPDLFTLYPSGSPEQKRTVHDKEEAARFMFNAVTPTMRQLLGQPRYDKHTGEGFSCFRCHPLGTGQSETAAKNGAVGL